MRGKGGGGLGCSNPLDAPNSVAVEVSLGASDVGSEFGRTNVESVQQKKNKGAAECQNGAKQTGQA